MRATRATQLRRPPLAGGPGGSSAPTMSLTSGSIIDRLQAAADSPPGITFVGASVASADGPSHVSWAQIHDEARAVGAALQARGLVPGDHVAILGPTSRSLITVIQGCWLTGMASMV